jgi:hypothetical protein
VREFADQLGGEISIGGRRDPAGQLTQPDGDQVDHRR